MSQDASFNEAKAFITEFYQDTPFLRGMTSAIMDRLAEPGTYTVALDTTPYPRIAFGDPVTDQTITLILFDANACGLQSSSFDKGRAVSDNRISITHDEKTNLFYARFLEGKECTAEQRLTQNRSGGCAEIDQLLKHLIPASANPPYDHLLQPSLHFG